MAEHAMITLNRGYRYRLSPTPEQAEVLEQFAGVCRLIYNLALEQRRIWWRHYRRATGKSLNRFTQGPDVTALRAEYDWIRAAPFDATSYALKDLDAAFRNFFAGRAAYPTPRRKGDRDGYRIRGRETLVRRLNRKWGQIWLPKVGWVKMRLTRDPPGAIKNVQITRSDGCWHAAIAFEWEQGERTPPFQQVGVDRGVAQTITLSTGEHFQAPDTAGLLARRKRAQKTLARRKKGSNRYYAQRRKVAGIASKMARIRTDWCHRTSTDIARRHGLVAIEALNIKGMTASAAGTAEEPGRNVAQKRGLNRSILEQCWGKFAQHLDYKLAERGGVLIAVPAHFTSQTCASCGVVDARSRESQAVFRCVACGHEDNADTNAAKEILRRSTSGLDVEAGVTRPAKRQPQESAHA